MPLYDGFFDAMQDESTGKYDRAYETHNFTDYFGKVIGSGVCVHENPDSFLVRMEGGQAVVSPGYLFIQGYWLKNDADYMLQLPESGTYAIVAHLNMGRRLIELTAQSAEELHTDSLVLAIVDIVAGTAEDKRYDPDVCGVISTAGELSGKAAWAVNYIDNEIKTKLAAMEQKIAGQSAKLDAEIAKVQEEVDRISPSPVGTIKFSAEPNVAANWLKCDGSTVSKDDYPALVAALQEIQGDIGDTAQLPDLEMGGIPGYIKAHTDDDMIDICVDVDLKVSPLNIEILFNRETFSMDGQGYIRSVPRDGNFSVGLRYTAGGYYGSSYKLLLNGSTAVTTTSGSYPAGTEFTQSFKVSDYIPSISLVVQYR